MGVTNHRVRDAAHQSPPHTPAPSTAHDDEPRPYLLGHLQDLLSPMAFAYRVNYLQVLLSDLAPACCIFSTCSSRTFSAWVWSCSTTCGMLTSKDDV